jgi:uncharacterized membrane protein (UPF0127 family)
MLRKIIIGVVAVLLITTIFVGYFVLQTPKPVRIRIAGVALNIELATTPAQKEKGLSGRASLPSDNGMLFVFDTEGYWSFWMNEMRFPLDIIWFNSDRQVVFFEQGLQPCGPEICRTFTPSEKAMYVLEVNAGFVAAHHISPDDMFSFVTA